MRRVTGWNLYLPVLLCGGTTLAVEVLALRAMTPAFGNSIFLWGAVLSLTLICLAVGYEWGGRLGDALADPWSRLVRHVLLSAVWLAALPLWDSLLLRAGIAAGGWAGPFVVCLGLFGLPMTLLATVVPLAFRSALADDREKPGTTLGHLFAVSTAGSVAGALLAAYLAIPYLGVFRSLVLAGGVLFLAILPSLWRGKDLPLAVVLLFLLAVSRLLPGGLFTVELKDGISFVHRESSRYGQIDVVQDQRSGSRILVLDGASQNWVRGHRWSESILEYVDLIPQQAKRYGLQGRRALVIGMGAGALVRLLAEEGFEVETVEIDGAMIRVARDHFSFPATGLTVHQEDGRSFVREALRRGETWDLIVMDAYAGGAPPDHLYSRQAFELYRKALAPKGLLAVNMSVFTTPGRDRVLRHTLATIARVFPSVEPVDLFPWAAQEGELAQVVVFASLAPPVQPYAAPPERRLLEVDDSLRPLTDDWNPLPLWSVGARARSQQEIRGWLGEAALLPH